MFFTGQIQYKGSIMDTKKLIFALIVEDFDKVKELYKEGKSLEAFEAFDEIIKRVRRETIPEGEVKPFSI